MKRYLLLVFLLLIFSITVSPAALLEYQEKDYINLRPQARDLDNDTLRYFFNPPLSNKGTWQTDYGDAGIYNTKVTVSDGRLLTVENITLVVYRKEEAPEIEVISPVTEDLYLKEGDTILFDTKATDLNKDKLTLTWWLDKQPIGEGKYLLYEADFYSQGKHTLELLVSDGLHNVSKKWSLEVEDIDRAKLLDSILSMTVKETEVVRLDLPAFHEFSLQYNISEPIGNDGVWHTTYDDAGVYTVFINIWDNEDFSAGKKLKILVENVDRPPTMLKKDSYWISEQEDIEILLNYTDPDGDRVMVKVADLPPRASYHYNTIKWKPEYNTVTKETLLDDIARRYHMMSRLFKIPVSATSNNLSTLQTINIRVFDRNRAPRIQKVSDITVNEGETVNYEIIAYDPDNDTLSYAFDGAIDRDNYMTRYGQAGTYLIKVTASDGFLKDSAYAKVRVLPVNQPPVLKEIAPITVKEGEQVEIFLEAEDPDSDELLYSADHLPEGAYMKGSRFFWKPGFDTVIHNRTSIFYLTFMVTDGSLNATQQAGIAVENINHAPVLTTSAQIDGQEFFVGEDIDFFVDVFDPDHDILTYTWQTGLFDSFVSNSSISLKYSSPGKKKVSVTVSDGYESLRREWQVSVKKKPKIKLVQLKQ